MLGVYFSPHQKNIVKNSKTEILNKNTNSKHETISILVRIISPCSKGNQSLNKNKVIHIITCFLYWC